MSQFKYVPLDAVLNYVSDVVKTDANVEQLKAWMLQFYKGENIAPAYDYEYINVPIKNFKAYLPPNDIVRIGEVIDIGNNPQDVITNTVDYGDYRLIINQEIFFGSNSYKMGRRFAYKGQNRQAIVDNAMYCRNCEIGWSIDRQMRCISIDISEGEIAVGYYKLLKDDGQVMIPDHPKLLMALASYATSRYFLNKAHNLTDSYNAAYQMFQTEDLKATNLMREFKSIDIMRSVNVEKHNQFVFGRNKFVSTFSRNEYTR